MSQTAIKVENLSKIYRLGEIGTGSIGQDVDRWFKTKILGKEDPFLKIGESNDRATKGASDIVYSLQDINFEINQGDAVGIIGRNGAGKSTLLKILSRVTTPTTGKINIKGRVASLLEVGTGFHPELTGRENIYLNGAILGMRKREIDLKLDEIIDFSGVERYIDTPVKRYSSGMYVRLAFAVAAHLESEILIVDEVLAVGDAEFQKKCLGKMGEVSKGEGRTVLFVSHNMAAVTELCSKAIFLENGQVKLLGKATEIVDNYILANNYKVLSNSIYQNKKSKNSIYFSEISLNDNLGANKNRFLIDDNIYLIIKIINKSFLSDVIKLGIAINDIKSRRVIIENIENIELSQETELQLKIEVPNKLLTPNEYLIEFGLVSSKSGDLLDFITEKIGFIINSENTKYEKINYNYGVINYSKNWKVEIT